MKELSIYAIPGLAQNMDISIRQVEKIVLQEYEYHTGINISPAWLRTKCRRLDKVVFPRMIIITLLRECGKQTLKEIALHYRKDHSTMVYSMKATRAMLETQPNSEISRVYYSAKSKIIDTFTVNSTP